MSLLVQAFRREVRDHGAYVERSILRSKSFSIAVFRSSGLALDFGLLTKAVRYMDSFARAQLCLVVEGHGYFTRRGVVHTVSAGDATQSDQSLQELEGYGGSPCELIAVEWDESSSFAMPTRGAPAEFLCISPSQRVRLRSLVASVGSPTPESWISSLFDELIRLGLNGFAKHRCEALLPAPSVAASSLATAYGALGDALGRLDLYPNLPELAASLGVSDRQANRRLRDLARDYGHPFSGFRELLHEGRLEWAIQLLSIPQIPIRRAAQLAGYRSTAALHHALALSGAPTPAAIQRTHADRW